MLNTLKDNKGARYKYKNLGRGIGSGKGKTSARGGKGQTARSGVALNGFEGGQMPLFRRLPKRGFKNIHKIVYEVVNFDDIQGLVEGGILSGKEITLDDFRKFGLLKGKDAKLKLLGLGELKEKISIEVNAVSGAAKAVAEKAGIKINVVA